MAVIELRLSRLWMWSTMKWKNCQFYHFLIFLVLEDKDVLYIRDRQSGEEIFTSAALKVHFNDTQWHFWDSAGEDTLAHRHI